MSSMQINPSVKLISSLNYSLYACNVESSKIDSINTPSYSKQN